MTDPNRLVGSTGSGLAGLPRYAVVVLACLALLDCGGEPASQPPAAAGSGPANARAADAGVDAGLFDGVVTPETVFADREQRSLYRMLPPVTENGQRTYTFQLDGQPGMDDARHFDLITITWAPRGQLVKPPGSAGSPSGVGGPGGGFVDAFAQTGDGAYDVRVTQGSLLPDTVRVPAFDVVTSAAEMVRLYAARSPSK